MILYTMMPHELVFPQETEAMSAGIMVSFQGVPLIVEQNADRSYRIVRNLSTDPSHYLDDRFCPGAKISI